MRQMLLSFVLLFAVVGESSLVGPAAGRASASPAAECSVSGIGTTAATADPSSGTLRITAASCEGLALQASRINLTSLAVR
jgi:hypothetical protein